MHRGGKASEPVPGDVSSLLRAALVNGAYLRLVDYTRMHWQNRAHFLAVSAQAMRRILVDHACRHNAKRGARAEHVSLDAEAVMCTDRSDDFASLDDAVNALAERAPRKAHVVELRFFGGLSVDVPKDTPGAFMTWPVVMRYADVNKNGTVTKDEWDTTLAFLKANEDNVIAVRPGASGDASSHVAWKFRREHAIF